MWYSGSRLWVLCCLDVIQWQQVVSVVLYRCDTVAAGCECCVVWMCHSGGWLQLQCCGQSVAAGGRDAGDGFWAWSGRQISVTDEDRVQGLMGLERTAVSALSVRLSASLDHLSHSVPWRTGRTKCAAVSEFKKMYRSFFLVYQEIDERHNFSVDFCIINSIFTDKCLDVLPSAPKQTCFEKTFYGLLLFTINGRLLSWFEMFSDWSCDTEDTAGPQI